MTIFLFSDQLANGHQHLLQLQRTTSQTIQFAAFLSKAYVALRDEISLLPTVAREQIPPFNSLVDLSERLQTQKIRRLEVSSALLCAYQLGLFIRLVEQQPDRYPSVDDVLVGYGLGQLSAAAVACSPTFPELIEHAVEAVRLAFRTAAVVVRRSGGWQLQKQQHDCEQQSWSIVIPGSQEDIRNEINSVQDRMGIPKSARVYISLVSSGECTVTGEPSRLRQIVRQSSLLSNARKSDVPTFGLWHAANVYTENNLSEVLRVRIDTLNTFPTPRCRILSPSSGQIVRTSSGCTLFEQAVREILQETVRWDLLQETLITLSLKDLSGGHLRVVGFDHRQASASLAAALEAATGGTVPVDSIIAEGLSLSRPNATNPAPHKIAVVGMSGRFPGAPDVQSLWDVLQSGRDMHRTIPADRFNVDTHFDPSGQKVNTSHTPYGCFIEEPGLFDPRFFNMSPREAVQTDPMHRLALVTAYEALEMSGFVLNSTPSTQANRVGTFYGQTSDDWREVNAAQNIETYFIPGGVRAFAPGRISYYFGFRGPSYSVDTACSSSLAAIQVACTSLRTKECDTAVAGGLNVLTAPDIFAGLSRGQFLSKTGSCKTWDMNADGYCRADGVGSVVLKRLEDAVADKDKIYGVILAAATNHSADAVSITHPHSGNQAELYRSVLNSAGVDPLNVSYVEMHGTGTQAGDLAETHSVTQVFARPSARNPGQALHIGAVKSNVGHSEAAAGVSALIKVLLMMQNNAIPPHVGIKTQFNNALPDLESLQVHIPFKQTPWLSAPGKPRVAFLNNFSAAGGNTAMVIEDAPQIVMPQIQDPRPTLPLVMSAKSLSALKKNIQALISYIEANPAVTLTSLSYTLTARRMHHNYRIGIAVSNMAGLNLALQSKEDTSGLAPVPTKAPQLVFVFTGQGAFYRGMAQSLYELSSAFREEIKQLDYLATGQGFPSVLPVIQDSEESQFSPLVTQLALVCIQIALIHLWQSWNINPSVVVGHSLGEYAALYAAGVLCLEDTVHLVGRRAQLLEAKCTADTHAMVAVKASLDEVTASIHGLPYEVTCINSPEDTVLAVHRDIVQELSSTLKKAGYKSTILDLPYAFHSAQLDPILDEFEEIASSAVFHPPHLPVISPLLSQVVEADGVFDARYLRRHAREPVNFADAVLEAVAGKFIDAKTILLEIGPHSICSPMVQTTVSGINSNISKLVAVASLRKAEDPWKTLSTSLCTLHCAGLRIDWRHFHQEYEECQELLSLPGYSFDNKNYWIDYINDWCLYKAEPRTSQLVDNPNNPTAPVVSNLSTSSVHRVTFEEFQGDLGTVVAQSNLSHPQLRAAVLGHLVNDAGLCPSSLYADIAFTLADYLLKKLRPDWTEIGLNCGQMEVTKPLIVRGIRTDQILQVTAKADLVQKKATLRFASVSPQGQELEVHATCIVAYEERSSWEADWASNMYWVEDRIAMLKEKVFRNQADKASRNLAYKLFSALVSYERPYQGMEEVIFDSAKFEATARISFQTTPEDGSYLVNPFWIDSVAHLTGFTLNGSGATDSKNFVYISHGWKSMRLARPLQQSNVYTSYVKMQPAPNHVMSGDVYILDGDIIIGVFGGVKFQRIPRRILNTFLPPNRASSSNPAAMKEERSAIAGPAQMPNTQLVPRPQMERLSASENKPVASSGSKTSIQKAMDIISEESDLALSELQDECEFANLGIDSLLSLQISGKIREVLDLEVHNSAFLDHPTIGDFKQYLLTIVRPLTADSSSSGSQTCSELEYQTSSSDESFESSDIPVGVEISDKKREETRLLIRTTIAEQMAVPLEEVVGSNDLISLGMDSLMGICILGTLREKTDLILPSSLFQEHSSVDEIERFLGLAPPSSNANLLAQQCKKRKRVVYTPTTPTARAVSILLQGRPNTAAKTLFLFPDGSGSATSYASIPPIDPSIAVYGLNCPFMTKPSDFTIGIEGVSSLYLEEVRRRQAHGPYYLGGWSAGGIVAYEVTQQLLSAGEQVKSLVLFDSPCPIKLEALPKRLHHFFAEIGLLGSNGQGPPPWLLPHFEATIRALSAYNPTPICDSTKIPRTLAIWVRHGVCRYPTDPRPVRTADEPKSMKWLLDNRTDFGPNGWDALLGSSAIQFRTIDGNHFTMMKDGPQLREMAAFIKEFLC